MNIAWTTDTHLNFIDEERALHFCNSILETECDALFITGDIAESGDIIFWLDFLEEQIDKPIYFVLGNHDYYRSDIASVRKRVADLCQHSKHLHWMSNSSAIKLTDKIALVGHGGWGDAKYGDFQKTPVRLNDHRLIVDLTGWDRISLQEKLHRLGEEAAIYIQEGLHKAKKISSEIWVLTHVPPFPESCWHKGEWGAKDWISDFACKSVGDVLLNFADQNPTIQIQVLCGHGHSPGEVQMRQNLNVRTGGAVYGQPAVEAVFTI